MPHRQMVDLVYTALCVILKEHHKHPITNLTTESDTKETLLRKMHRLYFTHGTKSELPKDSGLVYIRKPKPALYRIDNVTPVEADKMRQFSMALYQLEINKDVDLFRRMLIQDRTRLNRTDKDPDLWSR